MNALKRAYRRVVPKYGIQRPVIVHQMGKVGSRSVEAGLKAQRLSVPVYHTHFLHNFDHFEGFFRRTMADPGPSLDCVREGREIRQRIDRQRGTPWNLVSLVRDPIARDVSRFFFDLARFKPEFHDRFERGDISTAELVDLYKEQIDRARSDPDFEVRWEFFDDQIRGPFGLDVFAVPFPRDRGFQIYEGDRVRLLVIRLEDLDRQAGEAFRQFLDIPNFRPDRQNGAEEMPYADLHSRFKQEADLPEELLDWVADLRWVRHFYSEDELQRFKRRWTRAGVA